MQVVVKGLLGLALLSGLASCRVDMTGLGARDASSVDIEVPGPDAPGGAAGAIHPGGDGSALAGQPGTEPAGAAGTGAETSGAAGTTPGSAGTSGEAGAGVAGGGAGAGEAGTGEAGGGAAGTGEAGAGVADAGAAGAGEAGTGAAGAGPAGAGGSTSNNPDARPVSKAGCADDTREGFKDTTKYPTLAACSGGWTVPGLVAPETHTPQCQRRGGNDGVHADGMGCSVADLCAEGWHVCESVAEFKMNATSCTDGYSPSGGTPVFFVTRQHGSGTGTVICHPANDVDGTNNLYGCGNIGSPADQSCQPFTRMLRDNDCMNNAPWACVEGRIDYNVLELADVTKPGSARGGVLCCR